VDELSSWADLVLSHQDPSTGGIRGAPDYRSTPSVWSTAQVLVGVLSAAAVNSGVSSDAEQIKSALKYLTSTRAAGPRVGWGYHPDTEPITEVSSWATLAYLLSLESEMSDEIWSQGEIPNVIAEIEENLQAIADRQHRSGGWIPIGESSDEADTRTYSTVMALWVLIEATESPVLPLHARSTYVKQIMSGITWLLQNYHDHLGWVPNPNRERQTEVFIGLSAQITYILGRAEIQHPEIERHPNYRSAQRWVLNRHANYNDLVVKNLQGNRRTHDADVHLVGSRFTLEQSTFLWFPWSYASLSMLATHPGWSVDERRVARDARLKMSLRFEELDAYLEQEFPYVLAENLFAISSGLRWANPDYRAGRGWRRSQAALGADRDMRRSGSCWEDSSCISTG
jgi:hypothetical protein